MKGPVTLVRRVGRSTVPWSPKRLRERAGTFAALLGVVALGCGVTIRAGHPWSTSLFTLSQQSARRPGAAMSAQAGT
jgi:hypothetical protein